jgi:hypothetical protein
MAEVVGLIASVIAIARLVNGGIKQAKRLYHCSEGFETLQASSSI